jgi:hypothetical protein
MDLCRDYPDDSRTGMNTRVFPAFPQDRNEVWMTAICTSGGPNGSEGLIFLKDRVNFGPDKSSSDHGLNDLPRRGGRAHVSAYRRLDLSSRFVITLTTNSRRGILELSSLYTDARPVLSALACNSGRRGRSSAAPHRSEARLAAGCP